jgi:hypothetical protein
VQYFLLLSAGEPAGPSSTRIDPADGELQSGLVGPQQLAIEAVDLDPGTYNYRVGVFHALLYEILGPEGSFTITRPPEAVPAVRALRPRSFRLRRRNIRVGGIRPRSKKVVVRVLGVPPRTVLKLRFSVGGSKQLARKKANGRGKAVFKLRLAKRIRKALRRKRVKLARLKVTAKPPEQASSSVTIKKRVSKHKRRR